MNRTFLVAFTFLAGILWMIVGCGGEGDHANTWVTSQTRLEKVAKAVLAYAADNDGILPGKNWMDATECYTNDPEAYRSPAVGGDGFGFAFNSSLVGKKLSAIPDHSSTVMLFDSTVIERNAVADVSTMPKPGRYGSQNTVAFLDGTIQNQNVSDLLGESSDRLRKTGTAMIVYSADFDDHLPLASSWVDGLQPYAASPQIFHDPALGADEFGYALNKDVASKSTNGFGPVGSTAIVFDSTLKEKNSSSGLDTLPNPGRYGGKNALLYLDGHVSSEPEKPIEKASDKPVPGPDGTPFGCDQEVGRLALRVPGAVQGREEGSNGFNFGVDAVRERPIQPHRRHGQRLRGCLERAFCLPGNGEVAKLGSWQPTAKRGTSSHSKD